MAHVPVIGEAAPRVERSAALTDSVGRLRFAARFSGKGGGPLARLGIRTVRDLLLHVPHAYTDYSAVTRVGEARMGEVATLVVTVDEVRLKRPRPKLSIVEVMAMDETGVIKLAFFRQPWMADQLARGDVMAVSGKVTFAYGFKEMTPTFHEKMEADGTGRYARVMGRYPLTEGISAGWMRRLVSAALADAGDVCDYLPSDLVARRGLMSLGRALRAVHFPATVAQAHEARRRLAYDELLCLQVMLRARRTAELADARPCTHVTDGPRMDALLGALPFELSGEQRAAADDILRDMAAERVMNRLLLGDVGTGKTAVAAVAIAAVADTGAQAAVMAPTSLLATQHADRMGPVLDAAGITWALVVGSTTVRQRADVARGLAAGKVCVVFGTTALLSDDIAFRRLTLVVIDEQHRFGVDQRTVLRSKGPGSDMLAMTATPIPRTLALSLYGDLSCSRIVHRPRAGVGVETTCIAPTSLDLAYGAMREAIQKGEVAYVVCPLVDDSDDGSGLDDVPESSQAQVKRLHSVASVCTEVAHALPGVRVGTVSGRTPADEKDHVMASFRAGETQVLVCTTVVEVGVDVPKATVMLVHDADRFGLATLHQLRGRVGRGDVSGRVFLSCAAKRGTTARKRLDALASTTDGFELAELDLGLRHEGEVLGYHQHGSDVTLKIADLAEDEDLVAWAHEDGRAIVERDPRLANADHRPLAAELGDRFGAYVGEVTLR